MFESSTGRIHLAVGLSSAAVQNLYSLCSHNSSCDNAPMQNGRVVSLNSAIGMGLLILAIGVLGGYELSSANQGGSITGAHAPQGVDFDPVWKAWDIIDEKFVPAAQQCLFRALRAGGCQSCRLHRIFQAQEFVGGGLVTGVDVVIGIGIILFLDLTPATGAQQHNYE